MSEAEAKTVADVMVTELHRISTALEDLQKRGLPRSLVVAFVQRKTRLRMRDIVSVIDALGELNKELKIPQR